MVCTNVAYFYRYCSYIYCTKHGLFIGHNHELFAPTTYMVIVATLSPCLASQLQSVATKPRRRNDCYIFTNSLLSPESQWNNVSNDILSVWKYCHLFTLESNTVLLNNVPFKQMEDKTPRNHLPPSPCSTSTPI